MCVVSRARPAGCVALCYDGFSDNPKVSNVELGEYINGWPFMTDRGSSHSGASLEPPDSYRTLVVCGRSLEVRDYSGAS